MYSIKVTFGRAVIIALLFLSSIRFPVFASDIQAMWVVRDYMTCPEYIDKALEFDKDLLPATNLLATTYAQLGDYNKAISIFISTIKQAKRLNNHLWIGNNLRDLGNLFQKRGRRIFSTSEQQTVEVKPMPSGFKGWWLPADKLVIEEMWQPDPPLFRVGEPVPRTVAIFANGAFGNQIPEISFVYPAAIKGYADQPVIETEKTSEGLKGMRKEKWALIPNQAGKIKLQGISVNWWDVSRDELRTAVIPSKIINVLPFFIK